MPSQRALRGWSFAAVAFCLVLPSTGVVDKFLGRTALVGYVLAVPLALALLAARLLPATRRRMGPGGTIPLLALLVGVVLACFAVLFPLANSGRHGPGSDTDEAYDQGVRALFEGRFPYDELTYLGNEIHHMPGALLLASPFVALGSSAYQNLFWLAAFVAASALVMRSLREASLLMATMLLLSPSVLHGTVTGADKLTNTLQVLSLTVLCGRFGAHRLAGPLVALGLGLAFSSRPNFLLLAPPVYTLLAYRFGHRRALALAGLALGAFLAVTLPYLLPDPAAFAPLEGVNRITRFEGIVPHAGVLIPGGALLLASLLAISPLRRTLEGTCGACALIQGAIVVLVLLLAWGQTGAYESRLSGVAGFFQPFGLLAAWRCGMSARPSPSDPCNPAPEDVRPG